jgi:hypothetical protein
MNTVNPSDLNAQMRTALARVFAEIPGSGPYESMNRGIAGGVLLAILQLETGGHTKAADFLRPHYEMLLSLGRSDALARAEERVAKTARRARKARS